MDRILPLLIVAAGLVVPLARAGTGDLDPAFADHGRLSRIPGARGPIKAIELTKAGDVFAVGGGFDILYGCSPLMGEPFCEWEASSFTLRLGEDGAANPSLVAADVAPIEADGFERQSDGKIVVVGRRHWLNRYRNFVYSFPVVYRLLRDGSLDVTFGTNGVVELRNYSLVRSDSVAVLSDGRIVIAGSGIAGENQPEHLFVVRLMPDGSLDGSFGDSGALVGPTNKLARARLVRSDSRTFRVTLQTREGCAIAGFTANGRLDRDFGAAGIATVPSPRGKQVVCGSLEALAGGGLLVAGRDGKKGFVGKLLANGTTDPSFVADPVISDAFTEITATAAGIDGGLLVAGQGFQGTLVMRLAASGTMDSRFGREGRTFIELNSKFGTRPVITDLAVADDGTVIAAGGAAAIDSPRSRYVPFLGQSLDDTPFLVRLLGSDDVVSPGVLSFSESDATPLESDGRAVVRVRRRGGSNGEVSVSYRTSADGGATENQDFAAKTGSLTWKDGDTSTKQIAVDVLQDSGPSESFESFHVAISGARGGAGLGTRNAKVTIQPDGSPAGQIEIDTQQLDATENYNAQFILRRSFYFEGRVCVTLTAEAGTAVAGEDFDATPITSCWDDQQEDWELPEIPIVDDDEKEERESFTIRLSNPTGGAILGPNVSATVTLHDND